jgi:hypothetical protein
LNAKIRALEEALAAVSDELADSRNVNAHTVPSDSNIQSRLAANTVDTSELKDCRENGRRKSNCTAENWML